mmetsp:Transcript_62913/g.147615  ORF Transcript_62913/g.147615 Transcript_62913/m.147615 type:complete len:223 (+) Transcript_62913:53-721(+)
MLNYKNPDCDQVGKWLNNFSEHKRFVSHKIGNDTRWKPPQNAKLPGPGAYKVDRDHPEHPDHDMATSAFTMTPPSYSMPRETRVAPDGAMKGISLTPSRSMMMESACPGQYALPRFGLKSSEKEFTTLYFPSAKESQEALRERKRKSDVPGPGVYTVKRYGDDLGREKTKIIERAVKKGTRCWAAGQYSHIYQCMKPRSTSLPILPPASQPPRSEASPSNAA